jgi:hypothetical protein
LRACRGFHAANATPSKVATPACKKAVAAG